MKSRSTNKGMSRVLMGHPNELERVAKKYQVEGHVPTCTFHMHPGIVIQGYQVCENRTCRWYKQVRLSDPNQNGRVYDPSKETR